MSENCENKVEDINNYVPNIDSRYYTYGHFSKVMSIIESGKYYPIWVTGLAGNGKTQMIEQACARANLPKKFYDQKTTPTEKAELLENHQGMGREFIRVNFTMETDENDLIGGQRLDYKMNSDGTKEEIGSTFHDGPVVDALRRGAVLLLDEIDVGHTNRIMCLQSVLEGKGVLIKATGEYVLPADGFQVFATSNTKGRGSDDGKFIGTNIMNGAFLDRFAGMIYQDYPLKKIEDLILKRYFMSYHWANRKSDEEIDQKELLEVATYIAKLCEWASHIRDAYSEGACEEVITTRTLINIIQGYSIFNDSQLALELACERFDIPTKESFLEIYTKLNSVDNTSKKSSSSKIEDSEYIKITS